MQKSNLNLGGSSDKGIVSVDWDFSDVRGIMPALCPKEEHNLGDP